MSITLSDIKDKLSDDFQSTFLIIDNNILINSMGSNINDFDNLQKIVRKYIPEAKLEYEKLHYYKGIYDIYRIKLK